MKRIFFIFSLLLCLLSVPVTGFAAETDEEQVKYEDATADNMKETFHRASKVHGSMNFTPDMKSQPIP